MNNIWKLIIAILVSEGAGIIGSFFTVSAIQTWYKTLIRPQLAPPNWVFGPVWTTLFLLMGIAARLVWKQGLARGNVKLALAIFLIQLALNVIWSVIFFGGRNPGGAFIEIIFLWVAILATIVTFARVSSPAAWLLVPYIAWVTFAGYLNFAIWKLN
jgi:tryptophan-rich sensory protein